MRWDAGAAPEVSACCEHAIACPAVTLPLPCLPSTTFEPSTLSPPPSLFPHVQRCAAGSRKQEAAQVQRLLPQQQLQWKDGELQRLPQSAGLADGNFNGCDGDPFEFLPKWMSQNPLRSK